MKRVEPNRNNTPDEPPLSKWMGAVICVLLIVVVAITEGRVISASIGQTLSILLILTGVARAVKGPHKIRNLSELYLWLAFILAMYHLQVLAYGLAGQMGLEDIDVFRLVAIIHVLVSAAALWALGAWSGDEGATESSLYHSYPARLAAGLFIVGAVVFWVGARTFPGMNLESIHTNLAGHVWTGINFLLSIVITLGGLILFTLALREAGDRYFSVVGLLAFMFGALFWILHLAFRLTVMIDAAGEWSQTAMPPPWFEPWKDWSGLLFAIYSVLAYLGLAAYGAALLNTKQLPRWIGWTCIVAGLIAAPLGGLPLFIHIPLWLIGILILRKN